VTKTLASRIFHWRKRSSEEDLVPFRDRVYVSQVHSDRAPRPSKSFRAARAQFFGLFAQESILHESRSSLLNFPVLSSLVAFCFYQRLSAGVCQKPGISFSVVLEPCSRFTAVKINEDKSCYWIEGDLKLLSVQEELLFNNWRVSIVTYKLVCFRIPTFISLLQCSGCCMNDLQWHSETTFCPFVFCVTQSINSFYIPEHK
jgi:hypothetical protein